MVASVTRTLMALGLGVSVLFAVLPDEDLECRNLKAVAAKESRRDLEQSPRLISTSSNWNSK
jgi:hypothetical protein